MYTLKLPRIFKHFEVAGNLYFDSGMRWQPNANRVILKTCEDLKKMKICMFNI